MSFQENTIGKLDGYRVTNNGILERIWDIDEGKGLVRRWSKWISHIKRNEGLL